MIKRPVLPSSDVVTTIATRTKTQFVIVVVLVAAITFYRDILIGLVLMAFLTFHLGVLADQRKARQAMIKSRAFPGNHIMALATFLTELTLMLIVFLMTRIAVCLKFLFVDIPFVTGGAFDLTVGTKQLIVG